MKLSQSPVVLLCYACLCRGLCGDFSVSILFMDLIFQSVAPYFWEFSCFWVKKTQCPWWSPHCDISFPTTRDKSIAPERSLFLFICSWGWGWWCFVLFCFVKIFSWIDPDSRHRPRQSFPICSLACAHAFVFEGGIPPLFCLDISGASKWW